MTDGASSHGEAVDSFSCPHCEYTYELTAQEKSRLSGIPLKRTCDKCTETFSYYLDERGNAAAKKVKLPVEAPRTQNHGRAHGIATSANTAREEQSDSSAREKEPRRNSERETSGPVIRAARALKTLSTYYEQDPTAAVPMFLAAAEAHRKYVDQFAEDFRVHVETMIDQFSRDEYDRAIKNLGKLVRDINEVLKVLETRINEVREAEPLEMASEQIRLTAMAFPGQIIEQMDAMKQVIRESLGEAAPLVARHRELIESYKQVKEETKLRTAKRLLKELYTEDGIRQFLDQYFGSREAPGADHQDSRISSHGR